MKAHGLTFKDTHNRFSLVRLVKDFFHPYERWGLENRDQFFTGLICTAGYLLINAFFRNNPSEWNPFSNSSNGLFITIFVCMGLMLIRGTTNFYKLRPSGAPWYEKYMSMIITLLGLTTLLALLNLNNIGSEDATLWINIAVLLVVFIIAAGYFVEGSSKEKVIKVWFSLLGYYFSVVAFFFFLEKLLY